MLRCWPLHEPAAALTTSALRWVQFLSQLIDPGETVALSKIMVKQTLEKLIHDYRKFTASHSFLGTSKNPISPLSLHEKHCGDLFVYDSQNLNENFSMCPLGLFVGAVCWRAK